MFCKHCGFHRSKHIGLEALCPMKIRGTTMMYEESVPETQMSLGDFLKPANKVEQEHAPITNFESGAKSSGNLPPYECLTPVFLRRCARRMEKGMHYGKHNWKKGARDKAFILERLNHAMEHLIRAMQEIDSDTYSEDDDLAAISVNCMFAMEYQVTKSIDNLSVDERVLGHK